MSAFTHIEGAGRSMDGVSSSSTHNKFKCQAVMGRVWGLWGHRGWECTWAWEYKAMSGLGRAAGHRMVTCTTPDQAPPSLFFPGNNSNGEIVNEYNRHGLFFPPPPGNNNKPSTGNAPTEMPEWELSIVGAPRRVWHQQRGLLPGSPTHTREGIRQISQSQVRHDFSTPKTPIHIQNITIEGSEWGVSTPPPGSVNTHRLFLAAPVIRFCLPLPRRE